MEVQLKNLTNIPVYVYSADGDSLMIPPRAIARTEEKFLWRINNREVRQINFTRDDRDESVVNQFNVTGTAGSETGEEHDGKVDLHFNNDLRKKGK